MTTCEKLRCTRRFTTPKKERMRSTKERVRSTEERKGERPAERESPLWTRDFVTLTYALLMVCFVEVNVRTYSIYTALSFIYDVK